MEKLKTVDIAKDRIRLDGLRPPASLESEGLTVKEAKKILKAL